MVRAQLPEDVRVDTIYLHNLYVAVVYSLPYATAKLVLRGRLRVLRLALAALPLAVLGVNGFIVGGVVACEPLRSLVAMGCPEPLEVVVVLSLVLPHGVIEIPSLAAIMSAPLALELRASREWLLVVLATGVLALYAAALVEVYVTPRVYETARRILCPGPLSS
jgi:uncharacterized membrane protein SpoIIM required for sporulation